MLTLLFVKRKTKLIKHYQGFTLIELLIAVAIVSILVSIAAPSYSQYIVQTKIAEAPTTLSLYYAKLEQSYAQNRSYANATGACNTTLSAGDNFTYTCNISGSNYTLTASNKSGVGLGSSGDYVFNLTNQGLRTTTAFNGNSYTNTCWLRDVSNCI